MQTSTQRFNFPPNIVEQESDYHVNFLSGFMPEVIVHIWNYKFRAHANQIRYDKAKCGGTTIILDDVPLELKDKLPHFLMVPSEIEFVEDYECKS